MVKGRKEETLADVEDETSNNSVADADVGSLIPLLAM
jgi:hypothetical protein